MDINVFSDDKVLCKEQENMIIEGLKKTIQHNLKKQNILNTLMEISAVIIWMVSTFVFYIVLGRLFPELDLLNNKFTVAIIGSYFISDGMMFSFLYRNIYNLHSEITEGKIENYLLLPTNTVKYISFRKIQFSSLIQVPIALLIVIIAGQYSVISLLVWLISLIIGFFMNYNFWFLANILSFWFKIGDKASIMYEEIIQMSMFPIYIFLGFKLFFPLLPVAFVASGGAPILMNNEYWIVWVQLIILLAISLLRVLLWNRGLKGIRS